jgi:hypothetical protein
MKYLKRQDVKQLGKMEVSYSRVRVGISAVKSINWRREDNGFSS